MKGRRTIKSPVVRQVREIELLNAITAETSQSSDLAEILDHSLQKALGLVGIDRGGIYLLDARSSLLKVAASCGLTAAFVEQIDSLKVGEGFSGQVAMTGEPLVIQDLASDPRLTRMAVAEAGLHAAAVVPIRSKGKILGTLFAITSGFREFQPLEVDLLGSVGSQIGVAIENARLLADTQSRLAQLAALQETSRAVVSTLDRKSLLDLIVLQATALLKAEGGILNLVDWEMGEDEVVACTGTASSTLGNKIPLDQTLSGWVTLHNQPVIVNDVSKDPRVYQQGRLGFFSKQATNGAVAPLAVKDRVIGTLAVVDKLSGAADFVQSDLDLLVGFASQAAAAIENARLYAAEQRRADQFRVIAEIGRRLTLILDLEELLKQVVTLIQETFGYYHVAIGLIEGDEVVYQYGAGMVWEHPGFQLTPSRLKVGREGISGWVAAHGTPLNIPDVSKEPRYIAIEGCEVGSELLVPIIAKERVIGTLDTLSERRYAFDDTDLLVMQSLAHQVGAAIENARLFQAEKRRAEQFRVIGEVGRRMISVTVVDELLEQMACLIQASFGYYHVGIGLIEGNEVVSKAEVGACEAIYKNIHIPLGRGSWGWVAQQGEVLVQQDAQHDPHFLHQSGAEGIQSHICVPLRTKNAVIGVLSVASDRLSAFDASDQTVLQSLAHQAAVVIENIRFHERAQQLAVVEERSRLARELHDAVTQTLFSASLIAEAIPTVWEKDPQQGRGLLQELRSLSRGALAEMRTLLLELRPAALVETHLEDLLRQLGEAASGREGIPVKFLAEGKGTLPPEVHIALYRIAQEALNNVVKHARASQAIIRLCYTCADQEEDRHGQGQTVLLSIMDDGRGFDLAQAPHHRLGLGIMQERADAIGANLFIDSQPGEGTQVTVMWEHAASRQTPDPSSRRDE